MRVFVVLLAACQVTQELGSGNSTGIEVSTPEQFAAEYAKRWCQAAGDCCKRFDTALKGTVCEDELRSGMELSNKLAVDQGLSFDAAGARNVLAYVGNDARHECELPTSWPPPAGYVAIPWKNANYDKLSPGDACTVEGGYECKKGECLWMKDEGKLRCIGYPGAAVGEVCDTKGPVDFVHRICAPDVAYCRAQPTAATGSCSTPLAVGATCTAGLDQCVRNADCTSGVCTKRSGPGGACLCDSTVAFCNGGKICEALRPLGAACSDPYIGECASSACDGGKCVTRAAAYHAGIRTSTASDPNEPTPPRRRRSTRRRPHRRRDRTR